MRCSVQSEVVLNVKFPLRQGGRLRPQEDMGNPSAEAAAAEALGPRVRALLGDAKGLSDDDLAFWASCGPEILQDVGVLVATTPEPSEAIQGRVQALVGTAVARGDEGVGLLRVAVATFHGLKVAKRWDVLLQLSEAMAGDLSTAIRERLEDEGPMLVVLMELYGAVLLGYQHSGELFLRAHHELVELAPLIAAVGNDALTHRFVILAAALVYYHRAYEEEGRTVLRGLADAFGHDAAHRAVRKCESALREAAWILPPALLNKYLPTVEGKWALDEFSTDQHASTSSVPQNAGSITLKTVANVAACDFNACLYDTRSNVQLQLEGSLFQPLTRSSNSEDSPNWQVEGHWSQLVPSSSEGPPVSIAATKSEPWTCPACTLSNEASVSKCGTCGTERPKDVSMQVSRTGQKTTNPAPFQAEFDASNTFMRVRWSRGEQSGVWLARKEDSATAFNFHEELQDIASNDMRDSNSIPLCAYSSCGEPGRVLILEKPYSLSTYGEMAVEFWVKPVKDSSLHTKQTILASSEYELYIQPNSGALLWDIGSGLHVIASDAPLKFDMFHHVSLVFSRHEFQLVINGEQRGRADRDQSNSIPTRRSSMVSIGGCVSDDGQVVDSCFHGYVVDLRIWSDLISRSEVPVTSALNGSETGLIGYFPLVGNSFRLLLDASKHDNHAAVFTSWKLRRDITENGDVVVPFKNVDEVPVGNLFTSSVGSFEISGSALICATDNLLGLEFQQPGAIWHRERLNVDTGFRSTLTLEEILGSSPHLNRIVFALSETSFWDISPLVSEVSSLNRPSSSEPSEGYAGSALFVVLDRISGTTPPSMSGVISVYVWKEHRPLQVCRVSGLSLNLASSTGLAMSYSSATHELTIETKGSSAVVDIVLDLKAALDMKSSHVRTGVVLSSLTAPATTSSFSRSVLTSWSFESIVADDTSSESILHGVYRDLRLASQRDGTVTSSSSADKSVSTIACTRSTSDGSAIEQPTYGCQTCGIVHGAGLCRICASICHEGHELVYMGTMITACACSMRAVGQCKCANPVVPSDYPRSSDNPRVSQWYCNRCTVVNSADASECSVCGNKAPEASVLGMETKPPTESTSRALVPVSPTTSSPPQTEWSCAACTYLNGGTASKCVMCDSARPTEAKADNNDGLLTLYTAAASSGPTTWVCSACTMENQASNDSCFMCQTTRAVPVADPIDTSPIGAPVTANAVAVASPVNPGPTHEPNQQTLSSELLALREFQELQAVQIKQVCPECTGEWDSTSGRLNVALGGILRVCQYVDGSYVEKDGYICGLVKSSSENGLLLKLEGRYKKLSQSQENAVLVTWDEQISRFDGKWFRGDGSGEWRCVLSPFVSEFRGLAPVDSTKSTSLVQPFYSGLINMKQNLTNVCYQNSFLQSLFMTQAFRRLILSSKIENYVHIPGEMGSQSDVLRSVQELFARLIASQRPELDSHILQRCLPSTFQAGRQQDTSDFAHFLIDSLSQELSQHESTAHGIDDVFGGTQATILACKTCGKRSVNREYFWELLLNMIDLRYTPITGIGAVSGTSAEIATPAGYERINSDLNKDRNGAPYVYLCVKRKPETSNASMSEMPITDLVVKVAGLGDAKPVLEGYERIEMDLNLGGSNVVIGGKKQVFLFCRREPNGSPITDLQVMYGNEPVPDGFKQIRVDLNQGEGTKVFICYRCDMPITDVKIVNSGIPGYRMVDHVLNKNSEDPVKQYLAYAVGGSAPCITDMKYVPVEAEVAHIEDGWETLGSPSSSYPPDTTPEVLLIRRGHGNPIFAIDVFRAPRTVPRYNDYEVIDLYGEQTKPTTAPVGETISSSIKGDWLAGESVDRGRKSVRIHSVSGPIEQALVIRGSFEDKGEVNAVATPTSSAWSVAGEQNSSTEKRVLRLTGYWKSAKVKQAQLFDLELHPGAGETGDLYSISGTLGDGRGRPVAVTGIQTTKNVRVKWPISQVFVLRGDERVPEGAEVVRETCSGRSGNLLAQTQSPHTLYVAVKREASPSEGYVSDICVIYGEIDAVPENYVCIESTPSGHSANLNDGTTGVPIFVCYRVADSKNEKCLMDLALMWTSGTQPDTLPAGFVKIQHTPLGMEANLNQGTSGVSIHLCYSKCDLQDVVKPIDDAINGEYEIVTAPAGPNVTGTVAALPPLIGKFIQLSVAERVSNAYTVEGKFGTVFQGYMPGMVRGTLYNSSHGNKHVITGVWMSDEQKASSMIDFVPPSFPFEWVVNDRVNECDGWWSGPEDTGPSASTTTVSTNNSSPNTAWKLMKDDYVQIAFKKDYGTEWKNGELVSSERVWRHDVASMLSRFTASRTLGGDNLLSCSQCNRKMESRTNTVVVTPPEHLIVTLKRMYYDWAQQKTRKCLHDVEFPALLTLPSLSAEDEDTLFSELDDTTRSQQRHRQYGLYGVLVHSGLTANSGHYFSYCRESDDSTKQLHLEDSPLAPWIKFNDSKVEPSSWTDINRAVSSSVSDTVYLLLYKRLSYEVPDPAMQSASAMDVENPDDEDEAMLLAKAMALSMSAASKKSTDDLESEVKSEFEGVKAVQLPVDHSVFREVEEANAQFIQDLMKTASSSVRIQDLHTTLSSRYGLAGGAVEQ